MNEPANQGCDVCIPNEVGHFIVVFLGSIKDYRRTLSTCGAVLAHVHTDAGRHRQSHSGGRWPSARERTTLADSCPVTPSLLSSSTVVADTTVHDVLFLFPVRMRLPTLSWQVLAFGDHEVPWIGVEK